MSEKRVAFDFEIEFSNGGGIQGQGFRLDIDGDSIDDAELASCIIRDMNLLMVGEVRILNKKVIAEAHKRRVMEGETHGDTGSRAVDLSHSIVNGMMTYKGLPAPMICDHFSHEQSRAYYDDGTEFQIGRIDMVANTGTYLDTPYHRYRTGADLEDTPLTRLSSLPGLVVRLRGYLERAIGWSNFAAHDVAGKAVLVETGWSDHWGREAYFEGHPYLTEEAAEYLRDKGAVLVGIDSLNIDDTAGGGRPVHSVLLESGVPIVEHLTNLSSIPDAGFRFFAVPPKVRGMGTFPVRAHAILA